MKMNSGNTASDRDLMEDNYDDIPAPPVNEKRPKEEKLVAAENQNTTNNIKDESKAPEESVESRGGGADHINANNDFIGRNIFESSKVSTEEDKRRNKNDIRLNLPSPSSSSPLDSSRSPKTAGDFPQMQQDRKRNEGERNYAISPEPLPPLLHDNHNSHYAYNSSMRSSLASDWNASASSSSSTMQNIKCTDTYRSSIVFKSPGNEVYPPPFKRDKTTTFVPRDDYITPRCRKLQNLASNGGVFPVSPSSEKNQRSIASSPRSTIGGLGPFGGGGVVCEPLYPLSKMTSCNSHPNEEHETRSPLDKLTPQTLDWCSTGSIRGGGGGSTYSKSTCQMTARERRCMQDESHIFDYPHNSNNASKSLNAKIDAEEALKKEEQRRRCGRRRNAMYSDLFGRETPSFDQQAVYINEKDKLDEKHALCTPRDTDRSHSQISPDAESVASLPPDSPAAKSSLLGDEFYSKALQVRPLETVELQLRNLPEDMTDSCLKGFAFSSGCHLVRSRLEVDPVNHKCKGSGSMCIRHNEGEVGIRKLGEALAADNIKVKVSQHWPFSTHTHTHATRTCNKN